MLKKRCRSGAKWLVGLTFIALLVPLSSSASEMSWSLEQVVRSNDDPVMLRNSKGTLVRRLDATIPRFIYVVARDIMEAAETEAVFFITTGNAPNAAAGILGGKPTVLINLGMIEMIGTDMNEWAALIGHEIAHLTLDHQGKQYNRKVTSTVLQVVSYGLIGNTGLTPLTDMAFQAYDTSFSRDAERESDYLGVIWSVEKGYNPHGAAELHEKFRARADGHPVPFLSSHPSSTERIRTLRKLADNLEDR